MRFRAVHLVVLGALLLGVAACSSPAGDDATRAEPDPAAAPEATAAKKPAPQPSRPAPRWAEHVDELEPTVRAWAAAWSSQDVAGYLSHYSPGFRPPGNMSRVDWEKQRETRLTRPKQIAVVLDQFRRTGSTTKWRGGRELDVVKVQFQQAYASDTYSDEVLKRLELEFLDGRWQITDEVAQ